MMNLRSIGSFPSHCRVDVITLDTLAQDVRAGFCRKGNVTSRERERFDLLIKSEPAKLTLMRKASVVRLSITFTVSVLLKLDPDEARKDRSPREASLDELGRM